MSGNCTARLNRQTAIGVAVVTFSRKMPGQFPSVNDQTGVFQGFGRHFRENFLYDCFADFYIFRDLGESHASSCRCRMKYRRETEVRPQQSVESGENLHCRTDKDDGNRVSFCTRTELMAACRE